MARKKKSKQRNEKKQSGTNPSRKKKSTSTPWRYLAAPLLIVIGGVGLLGYFAMDVDTMAGRVNQEADRWAVAYWRKPIPPQGVPPADYLPAAQSLLPQDCGACHPAQYADWSESLHSIAMGPGVVGQFPTMHPSVTSQCRECHAPLTEQSPHLGGAGNFAKNAVYDERLEARGMVCAACHLRGHQRYGPPLREGKTPVSEQFHGEPVRTPHFEASEFCKGCHQHGSTTLKINGKTVENTYREWLDSPYPEQGKTCQSCHMPDRRHLWKGIHDKDMTLSGVTISTDLAPETPVVGERLTVRLTLANTGTGHAFPTYTTPAVFMRAALLDGDGNVLKGGYFKEKIIQRRLDMSVNPWREAFDTRILPGDAASLDFSVEVPPEAHSLKLWVWVEPDQFYTGFFRASLRRGEDFPGADQLRRALEESLERRYILFDQSFPIERTQ